ADRSNALLGALLPASADAIRTAHRLGLPESCASLEHATWYLRRGRDVQDECPELAQVSSLRMAQVALREPGTVAVMAGRGWAQATVWRLPYLGELAGGTMQRVAQPSNADSLAPLGFVAHALLWLLSGLWLVGCCAVAVRKRSM